MLQRYVSFSDDFLLESIINESIIYYSPELRKIFNRMKSNSIAINLLEVEATDVKPDITFVDLDKEGYLQFSTMRNAKKAIVDQFPHLDYIDTKPDKDIADELFSLDKRGATRATGVSTKSRNSVSIGKFVNKIFPGKYNDKDREDFVNSFKASIEQGGELFRIVEGDDIDFWYSSTNYKEKSGTLGNSCMAEKSGLFGLYTENPEVCRMLILTEDDKLIGRALVWKLSSCKEGSTNIDNTYFMDRQYTIKDSDVQKFRNYATEQGWSYKAYNNHSSFFKVNIGGQEKSVRMTVQLKSRPKYGYDFRTYPYMDTFRRYDVINGILHNDDNRDFEGHYLLEYTGGGYEEIQAGVWSEWYGENIPEYDAVYSDSCDTYLYRDRAVRVRKGSARNIGWWPEDHDSIVYDEWIDEYLHTDDTVYSEYYGHSLYNLTAVSTIVDVESDGDGDVDWLHEDDVKIVQLDDCESQIWYKKLKQKFRIWNKCDYILKKLLRENSNGKYILKVNSKFAYKVVSVSDDVDTPVDITGIKYLTTIDAKILGYDLDMDDYIITDEYGYNDDISDIIGQLSKRLISMKKKITDYLEGKGQLRLNLDDEKEYKSSLSEVLVELNKRLEEIESDKWWS